MSSRTLLKSLGPGLLFAALSIGVSHVVQSTRAGADYAFLLGIVILLALVFKYPAFRFGSHYAAATGHSLIHGYHRQGNWAIILFAFLLITIMFALQAAVTFTTAALAKYMFGLDSVSTLNVAIGLTAFCLAIVGFGRYHWVDRITKVLVITFTITTVIATLLIIPQIQWSEYQYIPNVMQFTLVDIIFIAALAGWMPTSIDIAVFNSLWTLARKRDTHYQPKIKESILDFNVGYFIVGLLAFCFLILGTAVLYGQGIEYASSSEAFAIQFINMYITILGDWAIYLISLAAFAAMFSTMLAVIDGYPRVAGVLWLHFSKPNSHDHEQNLHDNRLFKWFLLIGIAVISLSLIAYFQNQFLTLVDIATTISFVAAPILAWLNHRAVYSNEVPGHLQPSYAMKIFSYCGITALGLFAAGYVGLRLYLFFA